MKDRFGEFVGYSIVALILLGVAVTVLGYAYFVYSWMLGL